MIIRFVVVLVAYVASTISHAQQPPYDVFPTAEPPYYRVRYEASSQSGQLIYPVNYTAWIPPATSAIRGIIVHQHGCGEGSCKSGLTGAYDLHWQALAKKHDCALLAPSYEQPEKAECQMWCDPRNGSAEAFQRCLIDLGVKSGHPELSTVPWALWGHSGGGHWAGGMTLLYPERVAAAWLRSGVPLFKPNPERPTIRPHEVNPAALTVPIMCNPGTKEGVTVKDGRFAGVWSSNEAFFNEMRGKGSLICVAVDPLTAHECGNQRYMAIPWFDACLAVRLPAKAGDPLKSTPTDKALLAPLYLGTPEFDPPIVATKFPLAVQNSVWFLNEDVANRWTQYVKDTAITDTTPPPAPTNVEVIGNQLSWNCEADIESGLSHFIIERDGKFLARFPQESKNPYGRPLFQNLQYSDTPIQPLVEMRFIDTTVEPNMQHQYRVVSVNTVGLASK